MNSEIVFGSRVIRCSAGSNVRLICYWTDWKATYLTRSRNCLLFKREIIPQSFSGLYDISKALKRNQKHYNYPLQSHWVEWIYAKAWDNETLEKTLTWKTFSKFHSFQDLGRSMNKVPSFWPSELSVWVYAVSKHWTILYVTLSMLSRYWIKVSSLDPLSWVYECMYAGAGAMLWQRPNWWGHWTRQDKVRQVGRWHEKYWIDVPREILNRCSIRNTE